MGRTNKLFVIITFVIVLLSFIAVNEVIPIILEKNSKTRVFKKMRAKSDDVISGIVGIIPQKEKDGLTSYNGIGSGVIFAKNENIYYVVTARHVVDSSNDNYKIFTKDTQFSGKTINANGNTNFEIPDEKYYDSLLDGKVEYTSKTDDIAILSFKYDGDLTVLGFETEKLSKNDKIMVIGHPEGKRYQITYGYIKSGPQNISGDRVIKHNAYMMPGNSGGVALTENMKIAGINISGRFTLLGHFKSGYMIPYDIVKENIDQFNSSTKKSEDLNIPNEKINNWDASKVKMEVKNISDDKTSATLVIKDSNDIPVSWDTKYTIQRLSEGNVWYNINSNANVEPLMKIMSPNEDGITEIELDWKDVYGQLKSGTYRIVKDKNFTPFYSDTFDIE